jgi:hypothetical protein
MAKGSKGKEKSVRRKKSRIPAAIRKVNLTVGELIAAAFDTVGNEVKQVRNLVSSHQMSSIIGKRIVFI